MSAVVVMLQTMCVERIAAPPLMPTWSWFARRTVAELVEATLGIVRGLGSCGALLNHAALCSLDRLGDRVAEVVIECLAVTNNLSRSSELILHAY